MTCGYYRWKIRIFANHSLHPHHSQNSMAQRSLDCLQSFSFTHWVPLPSPLRDTGSWKRQWCSGETGSLVHCNQVQELVMQFLYSNVNNSSFLWNKAVGVSWPHFYGCPKTGSSTLLRCADVKKYTEKITWCRQCPVPSQISRMLFSTTSCASPKQALQKNILAITSDVLQNFSKWQSSLRSG